MMKECPHCQEDTFGWRELIALDYFTPDACKACGRLVRNDGFRQFLIFPAILAALFAGIVVFPLTPDPNNDKMIIVTGWNYEELNKILDDFNAQDSDSPPKIEVQSRYDEYFRLTFPEDLSPFDFAALVNYLNYPFDFDLALHTIAAAGKTSLTSDFQGIPAQLVGKKAIVY